MTTEQTFKTLIDLKLSKINEQIQKDAQTDWNEVYSKQNLQPAELEQVADKYMTNALLAELYLKSSKSLAK